MDFDFIFVNVRNEALIILTSIRLRKNL